MNSEIAVKLLKELVAAEIEVVKQVNSRAAGVTKKADMRERKAVQAVFRALTGVEASTEQVTEITSY